MNTNFTDFNLHPEIISTIAKLGFKTATEVQKQGIPKILNGIDTIIQSQTGSGKTASFAIPICEKVDWDENKPQALILTPTRELALQVKEDFFNIGRQKRIKVVSIFGKSPIKVQIRDLKQKTHVIVATPGRLLDHIERKTVDTSKIKYLVIDEADEMLNMGFIKQIEDIIHQLPNNRITTLLSATMPDEIEKLSKKYLKNPDTIKIKSSSSTMDRIKQEKYFVKESNKFNLLKRITTIENPDSSIIFCNTKQKVDDMDDYLYELGYTCDKIHGGMMQNDRTEVMKKFKYGEFRYLIATDVAARGIDVENISLVINLDVPQDKESYVHRIGRTGRKNNKGKAISFVAPHETKYIKEIEELIDRTLVLKEEPSDIEFKNAKNAFNDKMKSIPQQKQEKGAKINEEILKIHINAGKKQKMRPVDIVGTICNLDGIDAKDIGIISIIDLSTFVEILNNKGESVLKQLKERTIKGRIRKVNVARSDKFNKF